MEATGLWHGLCPKGHTVSEVKSRGPSFSALKLQTKWPSLVTLFCQLLRWVPP